MALAPAPTNPLQSTQAIVNSEGKPTEYFMRQWLTQQGVNLSGDETIQELNAITVMVTANTTNISTNTTDISALQNRNLTAGTGLSGGGDLTADRTFDLVNTAVSAAQYGDATNVPQITIDAQGRITSASNVPISGGGGGGNIFNWAAEIGTAFSGSAFASKGVVETFYKAVTLSEIAAYINAISGHTYQAGVYEINSSSVIQTVLATSSTIVAGSTAAAVFNFSVTAAMTANTRYYIEVHRTDGANNFAMPMGFTVVPTDIAAFYSFPTVPYAEATLSTFGRLAQNTPAVGQTVNTGVDAFAIGIEGSY